MAGTKTLVYCSRHARNVAKAEEYMGGKARSHHSEEETVVNVSPSGVKRKAVHPSASASAPSDGSGDSHKRAQHRDVESRASLDTARGSTAEGLTMPVTDMIKSSSVKAEVLLSL